MKNRLFILSLLALAMPTLHCMQTSADLPPLHPDCGYEQLHEGLIVSIEQGGPEVPDYFAAILKKDAFRTEYEAQASKGQMLQEYRKKTKGRRFKKIEKEYHSYPFNFRDREGKTPLIAAVKKNDEGLAASLLRNGATVNFTDGSGYLPLQYCTIGTDEKILNRLWDYMESQNGFFKDDLSIAIDEADQHLFDESIEAIIKIKSKTPKLLHRKYNARCFDSRDANGQTPLIAAIKSGKKEWAKDLISNGASTEVPDSKGLLSIDYAVIQTGMEDLVDLIDDLNYCDDSSSDDE